MMYISQDYRDTIAFVFECDDLSVSSFDSGKHPCVCRCSSIPYARVVFILLGRLVENKRRALNNRIFYRIVITTEDVTVAVLVPNYESSQIFISERHDRLGEFARIYIKQGNSRIITDLKTLQLKRRFILGYYCNLVLTGDIERRIYAGCIDDVFIRLILDVRKRF